MTGWRAGAVGLAAFFALYTWAYFMPDALGWRGAVSRDQVEVLKAIWATGVAVFGLSAALASWGQPWRTWALTSAGALLLAQAIAQGAFWALR
ncbi:MAG: hypothetical protein AAFR11_05755 [Pseudomonadota bacterium]